MRITGFVAAFLLVSGFAAETRIRFAAPDLLTFDDLVALSRTPKPEGELDERLRRLLYTPFLSNEAGQAGERPHRPFRDGLGPVLRVSMWNIERGAEFDLIRLAFSDPEGFLNAVSARAGAAVAEPLRRQARLLHHSDVLILNEVDLGMSRTEYRDVARELAQALRMNYAFGVEFVEVDRLELGLERLTAPEDAQRQELERAFEVDPFRYRGLHGTAVLSRYPIRNARIHRLPVCYDWYGKEKEQIARIEAARRWSAERIFLERISRELRHGGRMALIVELDVPEAPGGVATIVAPHLENKCEPLCRNEQMKDLLAAIRSVNGLLILGGDLNTTGTDAAPTSVRREISKRVRNPRFWAAQALNWFNPVAVPRTVLFPATYFKNYLDPTARSVPLMAPNREAGLFRTVENFRFEDGGSFDFRGDAARTLEGRSGTLANSNQRGPKGFRPTFTLKRDYGGLVGRFKLDWFLIKPPMLRNPRDLAGGYHLAPHFPVTMEELNSAVPGGISDHHPITVDLSWKPGPRTPSGKPITPTNRIAHRHRPARLPRRIALRTTDRFLCRNRWIGSPHPFDRHNFRRCVGETVSRIAPSQPLMARVITEWLLTTHGKSIPLSWSDRSFSALRS
jgi:endonuclease/exonuclease/phosphatase family metal-dependent hydrolase